MRTDKDLMHGKDWHGEDLAGMLLSEKLNGCRGSWDGNSMWSRDGNEIRIPAAWKRVLPRLPLDGEIWAGRDGFLQARLATQYGRFTPAISYLVFDAPIDGDLPARMRAVRDALSVCRLARLVARQACSTTRAALSLARKIQWAGGEGVMAQAPDRPYLPGRTRHLLKLKNF